MSNQQQPPCWNSALKDPYNCAPWLLDQLYLGEVPLMFISLAKPDVYQQKGQEPGKPQWKVAAIFEDEEAIDTLNEAVAEWVETQFDDDVKRTKGPSKRDKTKAGCPLIEARECLKKVLDEDTGEEDYVPTGQYYVQCAVRADPIILQTKRGDSKVDLKPRVYEMSADRTRMWPVAMSKRDYSKGTKARLWVRPRMIWLSDKKRYTIQLQPTTLIITEPQRGEGREHSNLPVDIPVVVADEQDEGYTEDDTSDDPGQDTVGDCDDVPNI